MGLKNEDENKLLVNGASAEYGTLSNSKEPSKKEKVKEKAIRTSAFIVFKYTDKVHITLIIFGFIFALLSGSVLPIMGLFFGGMTNIFVNQATNGLIPDDEVVSQSPESFELHAIPVALKTYNYSLDPVTYNGTTYLKRNYVLSEIFKIDSAYEELMSNESFSTPLTTSEFETVLNKYLIIYLGVGTFMLFSSFLQTLLWETSSERLVQNIRKIYFMKIIRQDISWYDQNDKGNLSNKLADDSERIREGTGYKVAMIIQFFSTFVSGIIVGFAVNVQLTLLILCVTPFLILLMGYTCKFAATNMAREQEKYAAAGAVAEETLSNIKTVNAFGGQPAEVKRYNYWLEEGRKLAMTKYNIFSVCAGFTFFIMYGAYGIGFAYGSYLVRLGISTPGSIFTVFFSVVVGAVSIGQALPFLTVLSGTIGVISSVDEIIGRKVTIDPYSKEGRKKARIIGHIEFRNVCFKYPSRPETKILDELNLNIEPGTKVAIVGSSGAGKSTVISLILRFYDPSEGDVCIDNIPVKDYNIHWLRRQIGLVSQEPVLFGVSIAENISYGSEDVSEFEIVEAAKQANAHDFISSLPEGYGTLVGDTGSQLSGGQKQRIAIARALVRDPKILLLDEATSALDAKSEGIVQDTLENAMRDRTTVIVAHRLSTIRHADTICVMQNGKLFERGTHDELMEKRSVYYELVQAQMTKSSQSEGNSSNRSSNTSLVEVEKQIEDVQSTEKDQVGTSSEQQNNEKENVFQSMSKTNQETAEADSKINGKHKDSEKPWKLLHRKVLSESITNEEDDDDVRKEYETIVTTVRETREILYSDGDEKESHEQELIHKECDNEKDTDSIIRKRKSESSQLTQAERKNLQFNITEKIEKEINIFELIKMQTPEWPWLLLGTIGVIGTGLITPIFALYYGQMFQVFTLTGDELYYASIFWTYMFIVFAIFCGLSFSAQTKGMTESNEKLIARSRALVFENILRQPVGWFDLDSSLPGILVNRLARNAPLIKAAAGNRAGMVLSAFVTFICAFVIAFICGWKLALALAIVVPIVVLLSFKQQRILQRNVNRDIKLMDKAGRIASESVRNIRTVQALAQEQLFADIYTQNLELPYKEGKQQALYYSILHGIIQWLMYLMYAMAFRFGGYLIEIHDMTAEDIYRVFFALSLCAQSVGTAFSFMQDYNKARVSVRLLNYLMCRKSEIDSSSVTGAQPEIRGSVEFRDVTFCYPTRPDMKVLKGLSFKVQAGETLALVGESGCGKSTVISLLERFYDPLLGTILVDDYDTRTLNIGYFRSKIGIVTQEPILFDTSIKDNIAYGAVALAKDITFDQIKKAAEIANIHKFIMALPERYDTMVGERGVQLSGGQKQRVAIARALIRNPKILLLDEATSALDTESEKIVQEALDEAKQGRTCIIVAHRLSTIRNADIICVVSKGKIVESGTHDELIALQGQYYQLTQRQTL